MLRKVFYIVMIAKGIKAIGKAIAILILAAIN